MAKFIRQNLSISKPHIIPQSARVFAMLVEIKTRNIGGANLSEVQMSSCCSDKKARQISMGAALQPSSLR